MNFFTDDELQFIRDNPTHSVIKYRGFDIHRESDEKCKNMMGEDSRYGITRADHPRRLAHYRTIDQCKAYIDGRSRA